MHPSEPAYPCCLPALGRFTRCTPHERLPNSLPAAGTTRAPTHTHAPARMSVSWPTEDSPRGLGRTLGKRVGGNPSRVRISYPPPAPPAETCKAGPAGPGLQRLNCLSGGGYEIRTREGVNPTRFPSVRPRPLGESSVRQNTEHAEAVEPGRGARLAGAGRYALGSPSCGVTS